MIRNSLLTLALACTAFNLHAEVTNITDEDTLKSEINSGGVVVVDFYAKWCGPCKQLAPIFETIAEENSDKAKFLKVEESAGLAQKYDIKGYPTVIFYKNGKKVSDLSGGRKKEAYERELAKITGGSTKSTMDEEEMPMPKKTMKKKPAKKVMKKKTKKSYPVESGCKTCGSCG